MLLYVLLLKQNIMQLYRDGVVAEEATTPLFFCPSNDGFRKGVLLVFKRVRFALQKESFCSLKGVLLERKRTTFENGYGNGLKTDVFWAITRVNIL